MEVTPAEIEKEAERIWETMPGHDDINAEDGIVMITDALRAVRNYALEEAAKYLAINSVLRKGTNELIEGVRALKVQ